MATDDGDGDGDDDDDDLFGQHAETPTVGPQVQREKPSLYIAILGEVLGELFEP